MEIYLPIAQVTQDVFVLLTLGLVMGFLSGMFGGSGLQMASYTFDKRGYFTVTLNDGSVWKQSANDTNFAHFGGKPAKYAVTLHPGDYGRSRMVVRGEDGTYVVERVR